MFSALGWGRSSATVLAADSEKEESADEEQARPSGGTKTMGGRQFWGDVELFSGWRIQRHVITGHHRLLDSRDYRYVSGTLETCQKRLAEIRAEQMLPPMSGRAVILLHGIIRSSKSMNRMREPLEKAGYRVFPFDYPSTSVDIETASQYLASAIKSLNGIEEINFVTHSMGGLVVRAFLANNEESRVGRLVMLGVPNKGAKMADMTHGWSIFRWTLGPAGQQLVSDEDGFIAKLPTPKNEFAVIAGSRGTLTGYNPLIPGDDDGTVTVQSTRLPGATDFTTVKSMHTALPMNKDAISCTVRFIIEGRLREDQKPRPIPLAKDGASDEKQEQPAEPSS